MWKFRSAFCSSAQTDESGREKGSLHPERRKHGCDHHGFHRTARTDPERPDLSVSVLLPDKPGELVRVAKTIADAQGNVIKLEHNQFVSTNRNAAVELRVTMEAFGTEHKHEILQDSGKQRIPSEAGYNKTVLKKRREQIAGKTA